MEEDYEEVEDKGYETRWSDFMRAAQQMSCLKRGERRHGDDWDKCMYQYDEATKEWYPDEIRRGRWFDDSFLWLNHDDASKEWTPEEPASDEEFGSCQCDLCLVACKSQAESSVSEMADR